MNSPNSEINLILTYDAIPKYRGGTTIFQQLGLTGPNEIWFYQAWSSIYSYASATGGIWTYKLGLYSDYLANSGVQVKLSAYWINALPSFTTNFYDTQGNVLGHSNEVLTGPNYMLNATTVCDVPCADPNLVGNYQLVMGDMKLVEFYQEGTYTNAKSGSNIDKWIGVDLIVGDQVYLEGGDYYDINDNDIYIYKPSTAASKGIPTYYPTPTSSVPSGYDFHTQLDGSAQEYVYFTAPETGTYWVGMDDWAGSTALYYLYVQAKRGTVLPQGSTTIQINTQTDSNFGMNVEAKYNPDTGMFDKLSPVTIGVMTDSNIEDYLTDNGLIFGTFYVDNYPAPTVAFDSTTLGLNTTNLNRVTGSSASTTFAWSGSQANSNALNYTLTITSPYDVVVYQTTSTATSYNWNYANLTNLPDGEYTITIQANDTVLDGLSDKTSIFVTVVTSQGVSTTTVPTTTTEPGTTVTQNSTTTITTTKGTTSVSVSTTTTSTPGFEVIAIFVLILGAGVTIFYRRRK